MDRVLWCASGVISFSVYAGLVLLFAFLGFAPDDKPLRFSTQKEIEFQVTLDIAPNTKPNKKLAPTEREQKQKTSKATENVGSKTPVAGLGIKKLFESVPDKVVAKPNEISDNRDAFASRKKGDSLRSDEMTNDVQKILSQLDVQHKINFSVPEGEYNEYYAQVDALLSEHWKLAKYQDSGGKNLRAEVLITIDYQGRFSYRVQKSSGDSEFDALLRVFLDDMQHIAFPKYIHASKRQTSIIVTIGSER